MPESFVMLAQPWVAKLDPKDWLMSEKLDGYRARWTNVGGTWMMISRYGNQFKLPSWFVQTLPHEELDGELYMGRGKFQELSSVIRHPDNIAFRQIRYHVFDLVDRTHTAIERYLAIKGMYSQLGKFDNISWKPVFSRPCLDYDDMMSAFDTVIARGGEGLMLREQGSHYEFKRSTKLRKLKYTEQTEAEIKSFEPGAGKYHGLMGAAIVETPDGARFRVGTGWSDNDRRDPPVVGARIRIQTLGRTLSGKARVASYKGTIL